MCHHHNLFIRQAMYVQRDTEVRWCNHCHSGKAISITYSECVFLDLGIQHATRIRLIILSSVACLALQYFSILPHSGKIKKKKLFNIQCLLSIFSTTSVWNIPHSKKKMSEIWSKMYIGFHVKCPSFFADFNETQIFLVDFWKILKYHISWKSVRYGVSCSIQMNRQAWQH